MALVGTQYRRGQRERARHPLDRCHDCIVQEIIGAAAFFPAAWLSLFGSDPAMIATGSAYLRAVGPFYGCFASGSRSISPAGRRQAAVAARGFARMAVAIGGGWMVLTLTGSLG